MEEWHNRSFQYKLTGIFDSSNGRRDASTDMDVGRNRALVTDGGREERDVHDGKLRVSSHS